MNRRRFVAAASSASLLGVAGCTSSDGGTGDETTAPPTSTSTTEPTPTTTAEPEPPEITDSSLLTGWEEFGDVLDEQVSGVGEDSFAVIGFRYEATVHDGTIDVTEQVRVYGPDGDRVDMKQDSDEQLVDAEGRQQWEHALYFDIADWEQGEYSYEVLIRDNVLEKVSGTAEGEFEVNEPLGPQEATISNIEGPDAIATGEDYTFTLEFSNVSDRDSSVVSPISVKYERANEWQTSDGNSLFCNVSAGESNTWESDETSFDTTGTVQFRIDAIDETWSIDVAEE